MKGLNVEDGGSKEDQEAALKELVSSTIDMSNVDTSLVSVIYSLLPLPRMFLTDVQ